MFIFHVSKHLAPEHPAYTVTGQPSWVLVEAISGLTRIDGESWGKLPSSVLGTTSQDVPGHLPQLPLSRQPVQRSLQLTASLSSNETACFCEVISLQLPSSKAGYAFAFKHPVLLTLRPMQGSLNAWVYSQLATIKTFNCYNLCLGRRLW